MIPNNRISRRAQALRSIGVGSNGTLAFTVTFLGLCIFTFAIVTFRFPIAELGIIIGAIGLLIHQHRLRAPAMIWWFSALIAWAFVASAFAPYAEKSPTQLILVLKLLAIFFLAVNALHTPRDIRHFLVFFVACFLAYPARGTLSNYFVYDYTAFGRALWNHAYANSNDLAAMSLLAVGAALAIAFSANIGRFWRLFSAASAAVFVFVVLLTQSRGGFIGLVVGFGPIAFGLARRSTRGRLYVLLALILVLMITPADVWKRLSGIGELTSTDTISRADVEGSAEQRWKIQKVGWQIFSDNAVWGVGLGGYGAANAVYAPELGARDTHNTYLNIAAETGLPGLVLWGGMMISAFRSIGKRIASDKTKDMLSEGAWIRRGLVALLVAGIFGTYAYQSFVFLMLAVLWSYFACDLTDGAPSRPTRLARGR